MSRLRVAGGEARGRKLKAPKNIRPTQGMVKQAIFNMVGPRIDAAAVLDLFAGSGALGIEALSRGAARVTFVDQQPRGLAILRQNLDALGFKERAHLVRADVVRWLDASPDAIKSADFVFLDPPYDDVVLDRALRSWIARWPEQRSSPNTRDAGRCRTWRGCASTGSAVTATPSSRSFISKWREIRTSRPTPRSRSTPEALIRSPTATWTWSIARLRSSTRSSSRSRRIPKKGSRCSPSRNAST